MPRFNHPSDEQDRTRRPVTDEDCEGTVHGQLDGLGFHRPRNADKGYESNRMLAFIRGQRAETVIPPKSNRRDPWEYERELYRERNLIERAFNKLKQ